MKLFVLAVFFCTAGTVLLSAGRDGKKQRSKKEDPARQGSGLLYCAPSFDPSKLNTPGAPLIDGLGNFNFSVTTRSSKAQKYFNQGLALTYGFNHGEAARSFKEALRYDSTCAMAYWGLAMVLGPNYNAAFNPVSLEEINDAIDKAIKYSGKAKDNEKALITAMRKRFPLNEVQDMTPFYEAYAESLKEAHQRFKNDVNIATIYADALMNLHPWNLWLKDGNPQPWTSAIIELLEETLRFSPSHPGAIHYYIHAIEASPSASKALPYADRLAEMMPAAGHMVHMPSHIYIRTGQYHKGVVVNEQASIADSTYIAQCKVQGMVPLMYYPHNIHFLAAAAFLSGETAKAVEAAWGVSRNADKKYLKEHIGVQHYYIIPYYVMVHTGKWDRILELEKPSADLKYPVAIWHYARGMAYSAKGDSLQAGKELKEIKSFGEDSVLRKSMIWDFNSALDLIHIASYLLEADIATRKNQFDEAAGLLAKAITIEDALNYNEPPDWFFSVRLFLGDVLMKAKKYAEAEDIYLQDLKTFPENGWALKGLYNSLTAQNKTDDAKAVAKRFDKAWKWADVKIEGSRLR
jgi:tetratricopeptide (TPR) repeat protein